MIYLTRGVSSLFKPAAWTRTECFQIDICHQLRELDGMDHGWWSPGIFRPGEKRSKAAWYGATIGALDWDTDDHGVPDPLKISEVMQNLEFSGLYDQVLYAHTTPHGLRIVFVLSEPAKDLESYGIAVDVMAELLSDLMAFAGLRLDAGSREPYRAMFAPGAVIKGHDRREGLIEWLNHDAVPLVIPSTEPTEPDETRPNATVKLGGFQPGEYSEARNAWLDAHQLEPVTRATCPICGHHECFQVDQASRWFCHSTGHGAGNPTDIGGAKTTGEGWGDALDLEAHDRKGTQRSVLVEDGFYAPPIDDPANREDCGNWVLLPGLHWTGDAEVIQKRDGFMRRTLEVLPDDLLYRRASQLVTLDEDKGALSMVSRSGMAHLVETHCHTYKWKLVEQVPTTTFAQIGLDLAGHCAEIIPTQPQIGPIDLVVSHPVLARNADGALIVCGEGYNREARLFVIPHGLETDYIPKDQRDDILEDLLVDYPLGSRADFENAVALMVTLVCRPAVNLAPMFYVGASLPGTGKSKILSDTLVMAVAGDGLAMTSPKNSEEELRKYLDAIMVAGKSVVTVDNLPTGRLVDSPSLAAILTTTNVDLRILGKTEQITARNLLTLTATGNNTTFSAELARRACPIMLVPPDAHPESREEFAHPHARSFASGRRSLILSVIFSAIQDWQEAGCPEPVAMPAIGSFEEWRNVVGGILEHGLGFRKVMSNAAAFCRTRSDGVRDDTDTLVQALKTRYGVGAGHDFTVDQVYQIADREGLFEDRMARCRSEAENRRAQYFKRAVLRSLEGSPTASGFVFQRDGSSWLLATPRPTDTNGYERRTPDRARPRTGGPGPGRDTPGPIDGENAASPRSASGRSGDRPEPW